MQPGDVIAKRYHVERLAGSDEMGEVYCASDMEAGTLVALKVLRSDQADMATRFEGEAEVIRELRHPRIVYYVAHGTTSEGEAYLAREWLEGGSLSRRLDGGPLSVSEVLTLGMAVSEALAVAHQRDIVHRDIKPSNLFIPRGSLDHAKILGFGVARICGDIQPTLTTAGATSSTSGCLAPEQARGERTIDVRADVFALGCVLFRCLTGRPVWPGSDVRSVLLEVVSEPAPRVSQLLPGVPEPLDELIDRMLAKGADDRPRDAGEVYAALEHIASSYHPPSQAPAEAAPAPERRSPFPWRVGSVAALVLVGLGAGIIGWRLGLSRPSSSPADRGVGSTEGHQPVPTARSCTLEQGCLSFQVAEPGKADLFDLVPPATSLARHFHAEAKLLRIEASFVHGGVVDLHDESHAIELVFQVKRPGRPGPSAIHHVEINLSSPRELSAEPGGEQRFGRLVPPPACSMRQAWRAAVQSGVPANALASFVYEDAEDRPNGGAWQISVSGRPELERHVLNASCTVARKP